MLTGVVLSGGDANSNVSGLAVIFLAWSFIGDAWDRSWIVWPIGGVLFGVIAAGAGAIESYRRSKARG